MMIGEVWAHRLQSLRVLVAEDHVVNQTVALAMLEVFGLDGDLVKNGAEAIEACAHEPYDVVFMDLQMPVMDGLAATRALREQHGGGIYIIAMTANAMAKDRRACADAGMDDYIAKPVTLAAFENALAGYLESRRDAPGHPLVAS